MKINKLEKNGETVRVTQFNSWDVEPPNTVQQGKANENSLLCDDMGVGKPDDLSARFNSVLIHDGDGVAYMHQIKATGDIKQDLIAVHKVANSIVMGIEK